jgi:hypothetical protein
LLALGEIERGLYGAFIADIVSKQGLLYFKTYMETPDALAALLGSQFLKWMETKSTTTTDEVLKMCLGFVQLTRKYKLFRLSVRYGDAILVEYLYEYFIPVWLMTSKHNYVEIALNQIEDLYARIPFNILQAARENRMQPLHSGTDRDGNPMAQWAMDALMELLQVKYKAMNFPNSAEGWQNHSTNMPLVARAKIFCTTEYNRRYDVGSFDEMYFEFEAAGDKQDKGNCKSQTKVPRRTLEKFLVQEVFCLADTFTETPERKMTVDTFWGVLSKITTSLERSKEEEAEGEESTNGRSHGEMALVDVNREMMQNNQGGEETPEEIADATELDQLKWFRQMEEEDAALLESDDEEYIDEDEEEASDSLIDDAAVEDDNANNDEATEGRPRPPAAVGQNRTRVSARIEIDDAETEVTIGTAKKKVKVRKAKFNPMGLRNVYKEGKLKMIQQNIPLVRRRRRCRVAREIKTLQSELDKYLNNKDGTSKLKVLLEKLKVTDNPNTNTSDSRTEFRLMKKNLWILPTEYCE